MKTNKKVALVTGGSRGLGRALSLALARSGFVVYATGRNPAPLELLQTFAAEDGLAIVGVRSDIASSTDNQALVEMLEADVGRLDLVVHNASLLGPRVSLSDYPSEAFEAVMAANANGPYDLTRKLVPLLGSGACIQFVTSGVGVVGKAGWGAYSVSKFALEGMAQIWAEELKEVGVRVFVIDPGSMRTQMRAEAFPMESPEALIAPEANVNPFLWLAKEGGIEQSGERFKAQSFPYL